MLFSEILDPWPNKMDLGTVKYKRRALIKKLQPDTHQFQNTSNLGSRAWVKGELKLLGRGAALVQLQCVHSILVSAGFIVLRGPLFKEK